MKKENIGLLFYGSVGSGKTYLACSIANSLIEQYQIGVKIRNFAQIINELQKGGLYDTFMQTTPRIGFWLDNSNQTPQQTAETILNARKSV